MYLVTRYWQDDWVIFLLLQFIRQMPCRCPLSQTRWWTRLKEDPGLKSLRYEDNPQSISYVLRFFMSTSKVVSLFQISGVWTEFLKVYIRTRKCLLHLKAWTKTAPWDILVINETRAEGLQSLAVTASGWGQKMSNWQGDKKMQNTLGRGGAVWPSLQPPHNSFIRT